MFNDVSIVSTAVSSFNNAALFSPYFMIVGLLALPIFFVAYVYGRDILAKIGWNGNIDTKISFWSLTCLMLWLLLMGGNYAVIRDGISLLPLLTSIALFVLTMVITKQSIQLNYFGKLKDKNIKRIVFGSLFLLVLFSAWPNVFNVLLNLVAVICGAIAGCRLGKNITGMSISSVIFIFITTLVLMQPEYFRFGQLGNLTALHLFALLLCGFSAVTVIATKYTNARAKIHQSAYIKLKWLFRILSALALILFVLTESVPVFLAVLGLTLISESLTIYHSQKINSDMPKQAWSVLLIALGIMLVCPLITVFGLLYLAHMDKDLKVKKFIDLL